MTADFVLDALERALCVRHPDKGNGLIHHGDRGVQCASICHTEHLALAGIAPSAGSKGDGYDNALTETINGPYKAEAINRRGLWKTRESVRASILAKPNDLYETGAAQYVFPTIAKIFRMLTYKQC